jgi:hypothetical protein
MSAKTLAFAGSPSYAAGCGHALGVAKLLAVAAKKIQSGA